jgi:hypothetical protein
MRVAGEMGETQNDAIARELKALEERNEKYVRLKDARAAREAEAQAAKRRERQQQTKASYFTHVSAFICVTCCFLAGLLTHFLSELLAVLTPHTTTTTGARQLEDKARALEAQKRLDEATFARLANEYQAYKHEVEGKKAANRRQGLEAQESHRAQIVRLALAFLLRALAAANCSGSPLNPHTVPN